MEVIIDTKNKFNSMFDNVMQEFNRLEKDMNEKEKLLKDKEYELTCNVKIFDQKKEAFEDFGSNKVSLVKKIDKELKDELNKNKILEEQLEIYKNKLKEANSEIKQRTDSKLADFYKKRIQELENENDSLQLQLSDGPIKNKKSETPEWITKGRINVKKDEPIETVEWTLKNNNNIKKLVEEDNRKKEKLNNNSDDNSDDESDIKPTLVKQSSDESDIKPTLVKQTSDESDNEESDNEESDNEESEEKLYDDYTLKGKPYLIHKNSKQLYKKNNDGSLGKLLGVIDKNNKFKKITEHTK
jgi:hypothetical protein